MTPPSEPAPAPAPFAAPAAPPSWAPAPLRAVADGEHLPDWSRLVVAGAARAWMVFAIVWGAVLFVGYSIGVGVAAQRSVVNAEQADTVQNDFEATATAVNDAVGTKGNNGTYASCTTLTCLEAVDEHIAGTFASFAADLRTMQFSSQASGSAQRVGDDVAQIHALFARLATASSLAQYRALASQGQPGTLIDTYQNDVNSLLHDLGSNVVINGSAGNTANS